MYEDRSDADLEIKCGSLNEKIHIEVLCRRSPVFAAMCKGGFKVGGTNVKTLTS